MLAGRRERAWKLKQGKRLAGAAKRSNLDVESRAVVRQRDAEAAIRRRAAWIAKEARPPSGSCIPRLSCFPAARSVWGAWCARRA